MSSAVSQSLDTLWNNLETDELKIVQPIADGYFSAIQNNPDPANVVAQSAQLEVSVVAALPNMEAAAAKDVATALKNLMDTQLAALQASNAGTANNGAAGTDPAAAASLGAGQQAG